MSDEMKKGQTEVVLKPPREKVSVTLQLDADVVKWFVNQGDEKNHINKILRTYMESKTKQQIKLTDIKKIKQLLTAGKYD
jgi:uncharacterized protein (DUF4415 family)